MPLRNKIGFSHNWKNKLNCNIFSTIRKFTPEKYEYYKSKRGKIFDCLLKGKIIGKVKLINCWEYQHLWQLDYVLLMLDTGTITSIDAVQIFKRFGIQPEDPTILLLFKNIENAEKED